MQTDPNAPLLTPADTLAGFRDVDIVTLHGTAGTVRVHAVPWKRQLELAGQFLREQDDTALLTATLQGDPDHLLRGLDASSLAQIRNVAAAFVLGEATLKKILRAASGLTARPIPTAGSSPDSSSKSNASPPATPTPPAGDSAASNSSAAPCTPATPAGSATGSASCAAPTTPTPTPAANTPGTSNTPPTSAAPPNPNSPTPPPPAPPSSSSLPSSPTEPESPVTQLIDAAAAFHAANHRFWNNPTA